MRFFSAFAALLFACSGEPAGSRVAMPARSEPRTVPCRPELALPASAEQLTLEPLANTVKAPDSARLQFVAPTAQAVLSDEKLADAEVKLDVVQLESAVATVVVGLDDFRARPWQATARLSLADLVPADRALRQGWHWLVAMAVAPDHTLLRAADGNALVAKQPVWIGNAPPQGTPVEPVLLYHQPSGTYPRPPRAAPSSSGAPRPVPAPASAAQGEGDSTPVLDFATFGEAPQSVLLEIRGRGLHRAALLAHAGAFRLPALASGDYELALSAVRPSADVACDAVGSSGAPRADAWVRVSQTITVNDAPAPAP